MPFATALAAVALDSRTVAALVERCYEEKCTRAVQVRATGGSWHGAVVDRYPWATMAGVSGLVGLDAVHLVVYGESGIFRSTDGGRSWHKSTLIRHVALAAVDGQGLLIVCASCGAARQDTVVAIDSGGAVGATLLTAPGIVQVLAVGGSDYVLTSDVVAGQSLRVSRDHGSTWQFLSPPGYWISGGTLRLASAGGAGLVLVVAAVPTTTTQLKSVYRSVDSGLTWTKVADAEPIGFATSVVEPSPDLLWRYGGQASVRRSSNGGATWTTVLTDHIGNAAGRQVDGFAAEGDSAWVLSRTLAGDGVDAYETHDGGGHWTGTVVPVG